MDREALIVQFQTDGRPEDYDGLISIEDALIQAFAQNGAAEVDGHDFGSGTMNIFVFRRDSWARVIEIVTAHLKHHGVLERATIAKRLASGSHVIVWPARADGEFHY
jgi:hypothetical protein